MVNTGPGYYRNAGITFLGIEALDVTVYPLYTHFNVAADFIENSLATSGGRVLVHCGEGISRSSTLVIAWLMLKRGYPVQEAVKQVVRHRNILPNQGFMLQLCQLHDQIQSGTVKQSTPTPTSPSVRSSVSPMPERPYLSSLQSSFLNSGSSASSRSPSSASSSSPSPLPYTSSSREYLDSSRRRQLRCPSPAPSRSSWSNGWTPPPPSTFTPSSYSPSYSRVRARSPSPVRSVYRSPLLYSPKTNYSGLSGSSSSSYLSPLTQSRLRCQSVDRDYGGSSINSSYISRPLYSSRNSLLMSSYLKSPKTVHFTTIR